MSSKILFVSDLDNTLIFSYKNFSHLGICVETHKGKKLSFMSVNASEMLKQIAKTTNFVPITTRSIEQYKRIHLFDELIREFALTSNGGVLFLQNEIDKDWYSESKKMIKDAVSEMRKGMDILKNDPHICFEIRYVDEMFVFSKSDNVQETKSTLISKLDLKTVSVHSNGSKIYIVPTTLNKGTALMRLKNRIDHECVLCAGDSDFDLPMLEVSDVAIVPNNEISDKLSSPKVVQNFDKSKIFGDFVLETVTQYTKINV